MPVVARYSSPVYAGPEVHPASHKFGNEALYRGLSGRGVALTTHPHLSPILEKEWCYTSTPPPGFLLYCYTSGYSSLRSPTTHFCEQRNEHFPWHCSLRVAQNRLKFNATWLLHCYVSKIHVPQRNYLRKFFIPLSSKHPLANSLALFVKYYTIQHS
jgi:hypothetical protein